MRWCTRHEPGHRCVRTAGATGQLYGSVSTRDSSDVVTAGGFTVNRNQVVLEKPIKALGLTPAKIQLHPEVLANVTVTRTSAESFLSVWPAGDLQPIASSLNWTSGMTIANAVTARIGDGGSLAVYNNSGVVDVIVDEAGYYG